MAEANVQILHVGPPGTTVVQPKVSPSKVGPAFGPGQGAVSPSNVVPALHNTSCNYADDADTSSSESDFDEYEECDCVTETAPTEIPYVSVYETEKEVKERGYFTQSPTANIISVERDTYSTIHIVNRYIYTIQVTHGKHKWLVRRRFSDFRDLNRKLLLVRAGASIAAPVHRLAERREERRLKAHTLKHRDASQIEDGQKEETDIPAKLEKTETAESSSKPNTVRVEKTIRIPVPNLEETQKQQHAHPHRHRPCKLPRFPLLPDTAVSQERLEQRKEELGRFIQAVLHVPAYRNHSETLEFLGVSRLSFVADLGLKSAEGYIKKAPGGFHFSATPVHGIRHFFVTRVAPWRKRWLVLKDSYVVYLRPKHQEISEVILFENGFNIDGDSTAEKKKKIAVCNQHRTLKIKCGHEWDADEWRQTLSSVIQSIGSPWLKPNRFESSYPIREESLARWFVDGRTFMHEAANMIEMAKEEIFVTDWWLTPEIFMKRPATDEYSATWRLDMLLKRKAEQGVKIFILVYKEVTFALAIDSLYSKARLQSLHPNIKVQRHRGAINWAHHEKLIVIDQTVAFVGGIDLCYGRWDDHLHRLNDMAGVVTEDTISLKGGIVLADKLLEGLASYRKDKEASDRKAGEEQKGPATQEQNISLKQEKSKWDQVLPAVIKEKEKEKEMPPKVAPRRERRMSRARDYIGEWKARAKEKKRKKQERLDESDESDEEAMAAKAKDKVVLTGNERYWLGKDYVNFIFKDVTVVDSPFTDLIDRSQVPRMPWHDISSVVYGVAARDVARHFIERWNACKVEKYHENPKYPFLLPKSYDNVEIPKKLRRRGIPCKVQITRSASLISTGRQVTEKSIYEAYLHAISTAQHYVYIENQFFVSQVGPGKIVQNGIAQALFDRIVLAHKNGEKFRVYVVMPFGRERLCPVEWRKVIEVNVRKNIHYLMVQLYHADLLLPGFEVGTALFTVLHWTYLSICKGPNSLLRNLEVAVGDPSRYISFCSLRKYDTMRERLVTELIYIHSKLLIADDRMVIIGSANINDRSQMGNRDSEVAIFVEDSEFEDSTMNGQPYKAGKFAGSLRKQLFKEHLGLLDGQPTYVNVNIDITDPASDQFFNFWKEVAESNSEIFEEVFDCLPNDNIKSQGQLEEYKPGNAECVTDKRTALERIKSIQGFLVSFPLCFLINSDLTPPLNTKEGWAPSSIFI